MAEVILMPRLSDTMTEGVITAWHKKVGDAVKKGDLLAEIETDKATMELESYQEGTLLHVGADNGEKLQVNWLRNMPAVLPNLTALKSKKRLFKNPQNQLLQNRKKRNRKKIIQPWKRLC
jgi:multidrug efflux pump subunit AcrA (membrane-fusion protein)